MEWMLFDALYPLPYGRPLSAGRPPAADAGPTETDLWITRQVYEFVAARGACGRCGAAFGRKLRLAVFRGLDSETGAAWRIGVHIRCRGWRRHRHAAPATEQCGELRFGDLRPR